MVATVLALTLVSAAAPAGGTGTAGMAALLDREARTIMARGAVPGAALVVVQDCRVVFERGYGKADLASGRPMDPERTYFRLGSISKVITATAAMRASERGQLDLEADVRNYLPPGLLRTRWQQPISIAQLLSHTSGYGEGWTGLGTGNVNERLSFEAYLRRQQPAQVTRPGEVRVYNSTPFLIAALAIERRTGRPFDQYVEQEIFRPIGMRTATQQLHPGQFADLITGYTKKDGRLEPQPRDIYLHISPGGDGVATAAEMARFAMFQLGCPNGQGVLTKASLAQMQRTWFRNDPRLPGTALGWEEYRHNGRTWLKKAGGAAGITTFIALQPETGFGFFFGVNSNQDPSYLGLMKAAAARLDPAPVPDAPPAADFDLKPYEGWYRGLRWSPHTWEKVFNFTSHGRVTAADGELRLDGQAWRPVGRDLFRQVEGQSLLAFRRGADGRVTYLYKDGGDAKQRLAAWETMPVQAGVLGALSLASLVVLLRGLVRRRWRDPAEVLALATPALNLAFVGAFGWALKNMNVWALQPGLPAPFAAALALPVISTGLLGWLALRLPRSLKARSRADRAWLIGAVATGALFSAFLWSWNLLGWWTR